MVRNHHPFPSQERGLRGVVAKRPRCADGCLTCWRASRFVAVGSEVVTFDDLVHAGDPLAERFRRHNVGLLVRLRDVSRRGGGDCVVANAHLHWDPRRADVKLAQFHALVSRAEAFADGAPVMILGDFNSLPTSSKVLRFAVDGRARLEGARGEAAAPRPGGGGQIAPPRLLVDLNLNRLCRWLRLLGVDAASETEDERARRTATETRVAPLVSRAIDEERLLVTSSRTILQRREAATCARVLLPSSASLEDGFAKVCVAARLDLVPETAALTRCVKCNGRIVALSARDASDRRASSAAPRGLPPSGDLFECRRCAQLFWWGAHGDSSAARAKRLADRLRTLARTAAAGVSPESSRPDSSDVLLARLRRGVEHGLDLRAASPLAEKNGRLSNFVPDFQGQLDYILYSQRHFRIVRRRRLPTRLEFADVLKCYLPNRHWPSDHVMVVADLALAQADLPPDDAAWDLF